MRCLRSICRALAVINIVLAVLLVAGMCWLKLAGMELLAVQSPSMRPLFRPGDALLVSRPRSPLVGEVISYRAAGSDVAISHRVVAINWAHDQIFTAGDALGKPDAAVNTSQVIGPVQAVLPHIGRVVGILRSRVGLAIFIYLPAAVLLYRQLRHVGRELQRPHYQLPTRR